MSSNESTGPVVILNSGSIGRDSSAALASSLRGVGMTVIVEDEITECATTVIGAGNELQSILEPVISHANDDFIIDRAMHEDLKIGRKGKNRRKW